MRMKQITAATMQDALHIARRDLGDEAVLLETRKLAGNRGITVVFAVDDPVQDEFDMEELADTPPPRVEPRSSAKSSPLTSPSRAEVVRQSRTGGGGTIATSPAPRLPPQGGGIKNAVKPVAKPTPNRTPSHAFTYAPPPHSPLELIAQALDSHATPAALKDRLMHAARDARIPGGDVLDAAETILAQALGQQLTFNPIRTGDKNYPAKALMLVGPHGAGKSSAIAKLATQITLSKRKIVIISTDTEHLGANDTLNALSDILKCEFHIAEKRALLREMIRQYAGKAWVLIDSAGVNIYEFKQMKALGELAGLQDVEPILTCPAGMDSGEAQEMTGVFSFLPIERMIVTRIDATRSLASFFAMFAAGGHALANMSSSANPSEACTPLSAPALSRLILRRIRERTTH